MAPKPPPAKGPAAPAKRPQRAVEKAKRDPLRHAVAQIRHYMISRNAEYGTLNDTAIILEAEKMSRELLPWAEKIKEIQAEIADIHYKLNHRWMSYRGHLYLFSFDSVSLHNTIKLCKQSKAYVADIQDNDEEAFLEEAIRHKHGSYYIGLVYNNKEWTWHHTDGKALNTYWKEGEPRNSRSNKCARLANACNTKLHCWYTVPCSLLARGICKKKPEDKWIN
ncbi:CD209 antigen-like protein E isoform X2 [Pantherophis guttatus]|uniref:CD209 antigen-like protein E isoform X2 n=1 Tax=Pantherophis guttatus TaxID=94885 RepID=A0ABM3ZII6_PANGU|nr:CD209 antigen-like protein E isoform X2 [Pantherophis guttatus]